MKKAACCLLVMIMLLTSSVAVMAVEIYDDGNSNSRGIMYCYGSPSLTDSRHVMRMQGFCQIYIADDLDLSFWEWLIDLGEPVVNFENNQNAWNLFKCDNCSEIMATYGNLQLNPNAEIGSYVSNPIPLGAIDVDGGVATICFLLSEYVEESGQPVVLYTTSPMVDRRFIGRDDVVYYPPASLPEEPELLEEA